MARGISMKDISSYVLEGDRELPSNQRTVFWIKPQTGHDANFRTKQFIKSIIEKDDGSRDMDVVKADWADTSVFKYTIKKIENFAFSDDYYAEHPTVKEKAKKVKVDGKDVYYVSLLDSEDTIADVCRELEADALREIMRASTSISKLKEGQKK